MKKRISMNKLLPKNKLLIVALCSLAICLALVTFVGIMGKKSNEEISSFIFSGEVIQKDGTIERGVFIHEGEANINTKLFDTEEALIKMSFSDDKSKIIALNSKYDIVELNMNSYKTHTLMKNEELNDLLEDAVHEKEESSEKHSFDQPVITNVFFYKDGFLVDYKGTLFYIYLKNERWEAIQYLNIPIFKEFFLTDTENRDVLLKVSDYNLHNNSDKSQIIQYYLADIEDGSNCKKIVEIETAPNDPFGDINNVCMGLDRMKFVYISYSCPAYASISAYDLDTYSTEIVVQKLKEFGTKSLTYRNIYLLGDEKELLCGQSKSGFSENTFLISGEKRISISKMGIKQIYCCAL